MLTRSNLHKQQSLKSSKQAGMSEAPYVTFREGTPSTAKTLGPWGEHYIE